MRKDHETHTRSEYDFSCFYFIDQNKSRVWYILLYLVVLVFVVRCWGGARYLRGGAMMRASPRSAIASHIV